MFRSLMLVILFISCESGPVIVIRTRVISDCEPQLWALATGGWGLYSNI